MTGSIQRKLLFIQCLLLLEGISSFTSFLPRSPALTKSIRSHDGGNNLHMKLPSSSDSPKEDRLVTSRKPHKLANGRGTFLGFRNVHDFKSQAAAKGLTALQSEQSALIPDGGLSPCVIRVLGVGGGGCNAVSNL